MKLQKIIILFFLILTFANLSSQSTLNILFPSDNGIFQTVDQIIGRTDPGIPYVTVSLLQNGVVFETETVAPDEITGIFWHDIVDARQGVQQVSVTFDNIETSAEFIVDNNAPALSIASPISEDILQVITSISGTAMPSLESDAKKVLIYVDALDPIQVNVVKNSWVLDLPNSLLNGAHSVTADITDNAGNVVARTTNDFTVTTSASPLTVGLEFVADSTSSIQGGVLYAQGTTYPGNQVLVFYDGVLGGSTVADDLGDWQFTDTFGPNIQVKNKIKRSKTITKPKFVTVASYTNDPQALAVQSFQLTGLPVCTTPQDALTKAITLKYGS